MPRRLTVSTREAGRLELLLIYQTEDQWEPAWRALQDTAFGHLLAVIPDVVVNQALQGYTKPFVDALGLPPQGSLRKLPQEHQACRCRDRCPFYSATMCLPLAKNLPDCFQPDNTPEVALPLAYEAIRLWREGVYIVVVKESADAYRNYPRAGNQR